MKQITLFIFLAFQLNSAIAQEYCDSTFAACDSVFLDSVWITHHPQYGDRLQVRIRTEHDFLHGPIFFICPTEDSIQFVSNSYPFFGLVGPTFAQFYYQFDDFNLVDGTFTGDIILNNTGTAFSSCVLSFSVEIEDSTTMTNNIFINDDIKVFPNPTKRLLNIKMKTKNIEIVGIQLFDLSGKQQQIIIKNQTIDLNETPSGLYFLKVYLSNGMLATKKIIKQ